MARGDEVQGLDDLSHGLLENLSEIMPAAGRALPAAHPYTQVLIGSYDDLEYSYTPPREEYGGVAGGCRYRRDCQVYARRQRRLRRSDHDAALMMRCEEQEPPLFVLDPDTRQHMVRCWARVDRSRWGDYVPRGSADTEAIGV